MPAPAPCCGSATAPGEDGCFLHNARYDFNDAALPIGVSFFARLAERFLEKPPSENQRCLAPAMPLLWLFISPHNRVLEN